MEQTPDMKVLMKMLNKNGKHKVSYAISSTDRAFGTSFGAELTRRFGTSLEEDAYTVQCTGGAGQSFGAFIPKGLTLALEGDSNDYFGKGLSGGKLIVYPDKKSRFAAGENIIIGNVALYGATSGQAYISGIAGERFCVRNSGATAVVEGVGDHGCEYMTGGKAVILGKTGRNFAAGMSGGVAYVLDEEHDLYLRVNKELVSIEQVTEEYDINDLRAMIEAHVNATNSAKGKEILGDFQRYIGEFKKIVPRDYSQMLEAIAALEAKGMPRAQAELEAFKRKGA